MYRPSMAEGRVAENNSPYLDWQGLCISVCRPVPFLEGWLSDAGRRPGSPGVC
jgi:hypothetical protein